MFQHFLHTFPLCSSTVCVYFFRLFGLGGFLDCSGMLLGCSTFWGCFRLLLGWTVCMHFYSIVVLFACISVLHAIRLITSFLYSSTACVHIYSVLALFCVHSSYDPALPLCASLLYSSTDCVHSHSSPALLLAYSFITLHIFSVRIPTVFQHCRREVLLHCSTLCIHFYSFLVRSGRFSGLLWVACGLFNILGSFLYCFRPLMGCIVCMTQTVCVHFFCALLRSSTSCVY